MDLEDPDYSSSTDHELLIEVLKTLLRIEERLRSWDNGKGYVDVRVYSDRD